MMGLVREMQLKAGTARTSVMGVTDVDVVGVGEALCDDPVKAYGCADVVGC